MVEDSVLDLVADCYVRLRAEGYLRQFPTFEVFLRRTLGLPSRRPAAGEVFRSVVLWPPAELRAS